MGLGHRRDDLRANAKAKLDDAIILLKFKRYSNAYYLAGYAVEIGLKACIAAQFSADVIPDKNFVNDIYRHELKELVGLAGLSAQLKEQDDDFQTNWAIVAQWKPKSRYESIDPMSAQLIISAITDPKSGVLQWIKTYW